MCSSITKSCISEAIYLWLLLQEHHLKNGYQLLYTPHVAKAEMWKTSGHLDFYAENMFDRIKVLLQLPNILLVDRKVTLVFNSLRAEGLGQHRLITCTGKLLDIHRFCAS